MIIILVSAESNAPTKPKHEFVQRSSSQASSARQAVKNETDYKLKLAILTEILTLQNRQSVFFASIKNLKCSQQVLVLRPEAYTRDDLTKLIKIANPSPGLLLHKRNFFVQAAHPTNGEKHRFCNNFSTSISSVTEKQGNTNSDPPKT